MDRCALFVDAGYLLADGAMAVHGTRSRSAVSWDYTGLLELLSNLSRQRTQLPLLRCYWYESTVEGRRGPEHDEIADLPGLKLRLGHIRPGRRESADLMVYRDLTMLARERGICDAVLVSSDEDMAQAVTDVQDLGVRVTGVHVVIDGSWTISRTLRQECDDLIEIGASQLRPYVNVIRDAGASSPPLSNGQSTTSVHAHLPAPSMGRMSPRTSPGSPHMPTGTSGSPLAPGPSSAPHRLPDPNSGSHRLPDPNSGSHRMPDLQPGHPSGPTYVQRPEPGDYSSPVPPQDSGAPTLAEAVKAAHTEGYEFGSSVARDAPALWLEAVLARKPRMPSDLEARLLQGSSLPIDFLLHDEVRIALRRGFWDALEQSRRT